MAVNGLTMLSATTKHAASANHPTVPRATTPAVTIVGPSTYCARHITHNDSVTERQFGYSRVPYYNSDTIKVKMVTAYLQPTPPLPT